MRITLEHEELTSKVIAAAIEVHRRLGPGLPQILHVGIGLHGVLG
jgi:hypothetical protein